MTEAPNPFERTRPGAPIGSLILIALMYVPWLAYFFGPGPTPGDNGDMEFPGGIMLVFLILVYLIAAIALPIRLYTDREFSRARTVAFYASLGILALFTTLIWKAE